MIAPKTLTGLYVCTKNIVVSTDHNLYGRVGNISKINKKTGSVLFYPRGGQPHCVRMKIADLQPLELPEQII